MSGVFKIFAVTWKRTTALFLKNSIYFLSISLVFFIPIFIMYGFFWNNSVLIGKIIDKYSLSTFHTIDNVINLCLLPFLIFHVMVVQRAIILADHDKKTRVSTIYLGSVSIFDGYLRISFLVFFKILCWSLVLIIPGIISGLRYHFAGLALLADHKRGMEALKVSCKVMESNIMKLVVCLMLIFGIVFTVCWTLIVNLDSFVIFFTFRGNVWAARFINYGEVMIAALGGFFFLTFYYYLYKEFGKGERWQ